MPRHVVKELDARFGLQFLAPQERLQRDLGLTRRHILTQPRTEVRIPAQRIVFVALDQREIGRALTPVTKPFQESLNATKKELDATKSAMSINPPPAPAKAATPPPAMPPAEVKPPAPANTTPAPSVNPAPSSNGHADFGTWSQKNDNNTTP